MLQGIEETKGAGQVFTPLYRLTVQCSMAFTLEYVVELFLGFKMHRPTTCSGVVNHFLQERYRNDNGRHSPPLTYHKTKQDIGQIEINKGLKVWGHVLSKRTILEPIFSLRVAKLARTQALMDLPHRRALCN